MYELSLTVNTAAYVLQAFLCELVHTADKTVLSGLDPISMSFVSS